MKTIRYTILLLCAGCMLSLSACQDFLETGPTTSVSDQDVFKTTEGANAALQGCYYHLRRYDGGGANRGDDWGIPSHQMAFDVCGRDIVVWGGWYGYDYNFWGHTRGDIFKSRSLWVFHYRLINNLNAIITQIDGTSGPEADKKFIKGQALALRGWAYFGLIRLFQHTYIIAKNMPGVPIYLEVSSDKTEGAPRGTVEETYAQITSDLTDAATLLSGFSRAGKKHLVDKQVVQIFLADVYLTMNQWDKAAENAKAARTGYPLMSGEQFQAGFNDIANPEWIWGMEQTDEQNMGDYSPFAMWANWTRKCYSFNCLFAVDTFVETFNSEDVRSQFDGPLWGYGLYSSMKFVDADNCRGSIVFTRAAGMLLTEVEALARSGKETEAKTLLWTLQDTRKATRTTSSGQQLIDDILMERRKELFGEGYAWYDLIRTQQSLNRQGGHFDKPNIPARSWRWVYQIPVNELTNNKSLNAAIWPLGDQNPFDGVYVPQ